MDVVLDFIRDQAWQFIGSIIGLTALIVTIVIYLRGRSKKHLSYEVLASEPLLTVDETITGDLKISYKTKEVADVHLLLIKVSNTGNEPIQKNDYDLSLAFSFGDGTNILSYEVTESPPQGLKASLRKSGGSRGIVLKPLLLNPSDTVILKFLLSNYSNQLKSTGRIVGVRNINKVA